MGLMENIAKPRPVGTTGNEEVTAFIKDYLATIGYEVSEYPFSCKVWETKESFLEAGEKKLLLSVSPFSESFEGTGKAVVVKSLEELKETDCGGQVLFLAEALTTEALQPKDYPFYYPDEHKAVIDCLEEKKPCAIVAVTGQDPMSGLNPFPFIEDGNFHIPVANIGKEVFSEIEGEVQGKEIRLEILSENKEAAARQLIASKKVPKAKGTVVICAHMDSKYNTDGALDNASGVAVMLQAAEKLTLNGYNIDIVPFNSEEYYDPQGELIYLEEIQKSGKDISLLFNIDTVAHTGSKVAVALFNFDEAGQQKINHVMEDCTNIVNGEPWYAGDHAAFAFSGTKCVLVSASDLFEGCLSYTHCPKDTLDLVDEGLIENAADFICRAALELLKK